MADGPSGLPVRIVDGSVEGGLPVRIVTAEPLAYAGPPIEDGYPVGSVVMDDAAQEWVLTDSGWRAVGSGRIIGGPLRLAANFVMATAATPELIFGATTLSFVYDGRPVDIVMVGGSLSHDQTATKSIFITILRASDSAIQQTLTATLTNTGANSHFLPISFATGPFTAWSSDSVALEVGEEYEITLSMTAGSSTKGKINATANAPFLVYAVTR